MARDATSNYGADVDTVFQWATSDGDFFDRELDMSFLARAVERHDHSAGRGIAVGRVAAGSIVTASYAAGSVDSNAIGAGQVGTTKIAASAVTGDKLAVDAVTETKIANLAVTLGKLAAGAVNSTKLVAGTVVAHLGYTPANKAGENFTGASDFKTTNPAAVALGTQNTGADPGYGFGVLNQAGNAWEILVRHAQADFSIPVNVPALTCTSLNGGTPWHSGNDGAGSGLDADLLDGQSSAFYATAASVAALATMPSGGIIIFRTQAELNAAGAGWTTAAEFAGRIPVGAGTTFTQTFVANTPYGANWTPVTGLSSAAMSGPSETFPVAGGGTQVASAAHVHTPGAINGQGSVWHPPMYGVIYGLKI
jgi:hypothetical protein